MKIASLILARKNSKRLPQKNKRIFLDQPLFLHQINISKKIKTIKEIFISTDDEDIQLISKKENIKVLKRSSKFATDSCSAEKTILEDIKKIKKIDKQISHLIILQPTNPLFEGKYLNRGIKKISSKKFKSIQTYVEKKFFEINNKDFYKVRKNMQELNSRKIETGMFWIIEIKEFLKIKNRIMEPVGYIKISNDDNVDIDTIEDFLSYEQKFKLKYYKNTEYYYKKVKQKHNFDKYQSAIKIDPDGIRRKPFQEKENKLEFNKDEIKYVNNLKFKKKNNPRLLDLGCGAGFVSSVISNKFEKYGLEVGKDSYKFAKKYFNHIHFGPLKKDIYKKNFFDVIIFLHVIEHTPNPIELLEIILKILKPGGKLVLSTPDFDSACARRFGKNFRMLHDITHISLFSSQKLIELLIDLGFRIEKIDYPYFETKYFNKNEILKLFNTKQLSPAFYGNIMTVYLSKK
jgi:CMP-N-acetylneuraminic acid synthetase/2-polyprenyl-3-methyl-5-hydroxy-6-metoxy-1,4-benzoquinol methylase